MVQCRAITWFYQAAKPKMAGMVVVGKVTDERLRDTAGEAGYLSDQPLATLMVMLGLRGFGRSPCRRLVMQPLAHLGATAKRRW